MRTGGPIIEIARTIALTRQVTGMIGLALAALFALRQSYRVRRSRSETTLPEPGKLPAPPPHVSIILPVRNEESNIDAVLASLLAQDYSAFDVTVIDDGSTDATPDLLATWLTPPDERDR